MKSARKNLLAMAVSASTAMASLPVQALVESYEMRVSTGVENGEWLSLPVTYTQWINTGGHYDCSIWEPAPILVDYGQSYLQTRLCFQDQEREAIFTEEHTGSGEIDETRRVKEYQTIQEEESQIAVGERREWSSFDSTYTQWVDVSGRHSYTEWTPASDGQIQDYTQERTYAVTQERYEQKRERDSVTGDIRDVGDPVLQTQDDTRQESRTVDVTVSSWANTASKVCGAWSPVPSTVDFGQTFTQTRTCDQDQERIWTHADDGSVIHSRTEDRVNVFEETQEAVGERRDWQPISSTFTDWSNIGSRKNYTVWSPAITTQESDFGQTRGYDQDQQRFEQKREQDQVTGDIRNVGDPITHNQTISGTESRTVSVTVGTWTDDGAHYACGSWSPTPDSVNFGEVFTQTRDCSQDQTRSRIYKDGSTTVDNQTDSRTITETESQQATGSFRNWEPTTSTFTDWTNDGARYGYSAWSPAANAQTAGFTQTRTYSQDQDRYEQKRERDSVTGDIRDVGDPILREQTIGGSESRAVTVRWSGWVNNGADQNCGTWSPAQSTVNYGETFTQSRTCDEPQKRNRIYEVGSTTINTAEETRLNEVIRTQQVTGTKRDWQPIASTYTAWTNDGARYGHTAWSPAANAQTAGFTQTRSYSQDQDRYEQKREQDAVTGDIRNVGSPILQEQTITGSENRSVTVSWSAWMDSGTHYACGTWGPAPNTVNYGETFTQTRDCSQDQTRSRIYKVGTTTIYTATESQTITETESQGATGTKRDWQPIASTFTGWTNDGARYNYGTWSPAASSQTAGFTQTRSYSQDQDRYEQKREQDQVTGDIRTVGDPILREQTISGSESRSVTVSWSSWVNNGADQNCGTWSPATSTVNYGQTFTQSRTCDEPEKRDRIYKVGTSTINTAQETRLNEVTRTQSATGTKRDWQPIESTYTSWNATGNHSFSAWSPAPTTQTANFTQTRSYKQNQERYEQRREQDQVTGDIRNLGDPILRTRTVDLSQSRSVVVSWTSWADSGTPTNCSAWSPDRATVPYGDAMTQTRDCDQLQTRTRIYKTGTTTLNSFGETQTVKVEQTNTTTGTGRDWQPMVSSQTSWTNVGGRYNYSTWGPAVGTQTADFDQTRTYDQDQTRTVTEREYDTYTNEIRVVSTTTENRTIQGTDTRTVNVTYSQWSKTGSTYSCGAWSPATIEVRDGQSFEQTRDCSTDEVRTRYYTANSTALGTATETRQDRPTTETQTAMGTNKPPVAAWSALRATTDTRYSTTFTLNNTDDGMIDRYVIDYGDGTSGTSLSHKYAPGSYTATMTVWDDLNQSATASPISINVSQYDAHPTVTINHDYPNTYADIHYAGVMPVGTRTFSLTASDDFGISRYDYEWVHTEYSGTGVTGTWPGSGSGAFTNKSFSRYLNVGDWFLNMEVTDTRGQKDTVSIYVEIRGGKNCQYNRSTGYYAQNDTFYWNGSTVSSNTTYEYGKGALKATEAGSKGDVNYYEVCRYTAYNP